MAFTGLASQFLSAFGLWKRHCFKLIPSQCPVPPHPGFTDHKIEQDSVVWGIPLPTSLRVSLKDQIRYPRFTKLPPSPPSFQR